MTFNETKEELDITLGDSEDVTFTPEEKTRALTKAWNDPYVVKTVWDSSLAFDSTIYQYAIPTSMTTVKGVYISASNSSSDNPEPIDASLWSVIDGYIHFTPTAARTIPTGYTLYIKGGKKLDPTTDTLDTVGLQEYVIALGGYNTLSLLGYKKANLFLKNDTSMGELITLKRDIKDDVREARAKLLREFEAI